MSAEQACRNGEAEIPGGADAASARGFAGVRAAAAGQQQQQEEEGGPAKPAAAAGLSGTAREVWMGGESEDWRKKRAEEDRRSLEEGKGFSGIIIDQIADVFSGNWGSGKKKDGGDEEQPKSR